MTFTQYINTGTAAAAAVPTPAGRRANDLIVDELFPQVPGLYESFVHGANLLLTDCGGGKALHRLALRFPNSRFVGVDSIPWNIASAANHARAARIGNLWFHNDSPDDVEMPPVYNAVLSLDPHNRFAHDPHWIVRIAGAVRPGGALFLENDNGTARATLIAMGFRRICEVRPAGAPQRRFIVAVR